MATVREGTNYVNSRNYFCQTCKWLTEQGKKKERKNERAIFFYFFKGNTLF
jgi:hypothetical protein